MDKIVVHGGNKLTGNVHIEGAKNAVLPILAATILASSGKSQLTNAPILSDVHIMNEVLRSLDLEVKFDENQNKITVDATGSLSSEAPFEYVSKMRASIVVLGPLLARLGHARVALPGGCAIGSRPIDIHLRGFEAMGAKIEQHEGYVEASAPNGLKGAEIYFDFPSVGATQNIMMAATLAHGKTVIKNVAREAEIVDLADMLNDMGAKISGAGTDTVTVEGVQSLHGVSHRVVQDRIEAGTFMAAAAITAGNVLIEDGVADHNLPFISKLREMGVKVEQEKNGIRVIGPDELKPVDVETAPYPGFPTDMQSQMTVLQLAANGVSTLTENVFENRFMHLDELRRMNAKYEIKGNSVIMYGPTDFEGAEVAATDLRAAAALILAGLIAKGETIITNLQYLDRGYYEIEKKLRNLGADIERVSTGA
ncbi:UDP-N-acetylglucosamine 1-carboxyvinyltransferase [Fructilactobacillus lindneri]|uniref:UDP-N-acetylglucosamine 1-carboxyvinyltransferase n=1 Tax=Fructilactobacillus lindneri DSM 20690 = JCM 11027 TaxID=1122148 RepID=A0A0R2JQ31_9LACO|nr:UDP-N-acetylglucosamine 1-carboxyvinyltransferase [Fructilactobacillus lindneri]KRN79201.1 UDP-N-acetylglucosamine 1-carboxyvinyltransferase 1 [Fructilactobacillus lindneri DSM 20690 = JCM 11027]POH07840.1 UDP-N-acetylglucosamine 1-carboxyvinyltransferase [Fructilactobacillus lindneri]POH08059.1 UDP-N-acetylglucosamine 1-carboxyvinyltransferase [Fructilactobacillus lindneri]POH24572.1 UDP-N-acetylglucosamine 1-carboxyvinyltransferase [Fructilactobacillus lindneri DSM 20690 = JCM 11027]SJZ72